MAGGGRALRRSAGTVALLLIIVLLALGGALLAGHAPVLGRPSGSAVTFSLPTAIWGLLFLGPLLIGFAAYVVRWALTSPASVPTRVGASLAVAAVVGLALSGIAFSVNWTGASAVTLGDTGSGPGNGTATNGGHGAAGGSPGNSTPNGTGTPSPGQNNTTTQNSSGGGSSNGTGNGTGSKTGGHGGGGRYGTNNSSLGSASPTPGGGLVISNWAFLGIAVGLSAVVAVLAVPGMLGRLLDRRRRAPAPIGLAVTSPTLARLAVREARLAIEAGESPREAIVRLYARLIGRVAPRGDDLAASTAEEIQRNRLEALRVPPARSAELTQMFEVACYSSHPIGRPDADRFVETMRAVERDLYGAGAPG